MCSSYTTKSRTNKHRFEEIYGLPFDEQDMDKTDDYADESGDNALAFPGKTMPVITIEKPNVIQEYEFGFIPHWAKPDDNGNLKSTHNAKFETIAELPTWRDAWRKAQRCLVLTNGFFEHDKKRKQKVFIRLKECENFFFAGIYSNWINKATGEMRRTMAIVTTAPNSLVEVVHHRMPVMIPPGNEKIWMDNTADINHVFLQYSQPLSETFMLMEDVIKQEIKKGPVQGDLFG